MDVMPNSPGSPACSSCKQSLRARPATRVYVKTLDLHPFRPKKVSWCLRAQPGKLSSPGKNRTPHRNDLIGRIAR